jgi:chaperone modulatory protein CbpM
VNQTTFTLKEVCEICGVEHQVIIELVEFGILKPQGDEEMTWQFSTEQLDRSKRALRLRHDLELNLQGVALALDLLEELETLRAEVQRLEQLLKSFNVRL